MLTQACHPAASSRDLPLRAGRSRRRGFPRMRVGGMSRNRRAAQTSGYRRTWVPIEEYNEITGRPVVGGREAVEELSDAELEIEITIAAVEPRRRAARLEALLAERERRRDAASRELVEDALA